MGEPEDQPVPAPRTPTYDRVLLMIAGILVLALIASIVVAVLVVNVPDQPPVVVPSASQL